MWHTAAAKTASTEHLILAVIRRGPCWSRMAPENKVSSRPDRASRCVCNKPCSPSVLSLSVGLGTAAVVLAPRRGRQEDEQVVFAEGANLRHFRARWPAGGTPIGHLVPPTHAAIAPKVGGGVLSPTGHCFSQPAEPAARSAAAQKNEVKRP